MRQAVSSIQASKILANPDNPNVMSRTNVVKLARNIGKSGLYEPLIVKPYKNKKGYFQIINGYHRARVLLKLGYRNIDCVVWKIDDFQTDIYLLTLNRLDGSDKLDKKIDLLKSLSDKLEPAELSKILTQTKMQIEKLIALQLRFETAKSTKKGILSLSSLVFFVNDVQKEKIEKAIASLSEQVKEEKTKAAKRAAALTFLAEYFLDHCKNKKK